MDNFSLNFHSPCTCFGVSVCATGLQGPLLSEDNLWTVFTQLLGALAAIHSTGCAYRILAPASVLVCDEGGGGRGREGRYLCRADFSKIFILVRFLHRFFKMIFACMSNLGFCVCFRRIPKPNHYFTFPKYGSFSLSPSLSL